MSNSQDLNTLWKKALTLLEDEVGKQAFDIWFNSINLLSVEQRKATLGVPNRYYQDWIRENFQKELTRALMMACLDLNLPPITEFELKVESDKGEPEPAQQVQAEEPASDKGASSSDGGELRLANNYKLNPNMTFANFIIGDCNKFANAASKAVADFPGENYNPLFLYGCTGLGKTHLTQAIANQLIANNPNCRARYTTAEAFVNEMINAIRSQTMDEFRARYRDEIDILLIDDIQFMSGKDRSQEEFFHTMEELKGSGRQIVVTSDVLPREIKKLADRLRTRFEGGLLADIQPPDLETMIAILREKCDKLNLKLPADLEKWIASRVRGNIRELEGALNRLTALSAFSNSPINIEFAQKHLGNLYLEDAITITPDKVLQEVSRIYGVKVSDIKGKKRPKKIALARHVSMYLARKHTDLSFPDLGEVFNRDNTTVQHGCSRIQQLIQTDPDLRHNLETIERNMGVTPN